MSSDFGQLESLLTMGAKAYSRTNPKMVQNADRLQLGDFATMDIRTDESTSKDFIWSIHKFGTNSVKVGK